MESGKAWRGYELTVIGEGGRRVGGGDDLAVGEDGGGTDAVGELAKDAVPIIGGEEAGVTLDLVLLFGNLDVLVGGGGLHIGG